MADLFDINLYFAQDIEEMIIYIVHVHCTQCTGRTTAMKNIPRFAPIILNQIFLILDFFINFFSFPFF